MSPLTFYHSPVVVHANIEVSCRAMLMRLFNDEEEVIDSTNKNSARPRANTKSELPDGEILPDSEILPDGEGFPDSEVLLNTEDVAEVGPELEAQVIEGEKADL